MFSIRQDMAGNISLDTTGVAGSSSDHGHIALFTLITAPVLRSVDPIQVTLFFKERETYELEIEKKQSEVRTWQMTPYTASIHRSLLKRLIFMGHFDEFDREATVDSLRSEHIKEYLLGLVQNKDTLHDPAQIRKAMEGLRFPSETTASAARITTYCADVFESLKVIGYGSFKSDSP